MKKKSTKCFTNCFAFNSFKFFTTYTDLNNAKTTKDCCITLHHLINEKKKKPYPVSLNTTNFVYSLEYSLNYTTFWQLFYQH